MTRLNGPNIVRKNTILILSASSLKELILTALTNPRKNVLRLQKNWQKRCATLVIAGCQNNEKTQKVFTKVAEALPDKNYVFLSAVESNYKEVGAAVGMAYGNIVAAESSVDLNLAKQLNILVTQLGIKPKKWLWIPGVQQWDTDLSM